MQSSLPFHRIMAAALVGLCLVAALVGSLRSEGSVATTPASRTFAEAPGPNRIAVIRIQGTIGGGGGFVDDTSAASAYSRLVEASKRDSIKAVLLEVNSPGGTVGASQEVYRAIQMVRKAKKPLVVTLSDVGASGAYYIASAADKIYANPGTLVGSIGIILQGFTASDLLNRVGIQPQTFKTGAFKDILSPFRPPTQPERDLLQGLIEDTLSQFIRDVSAGRRQLPTPPQGSDPVLSPEATARRQALTEAKVREIADGRIFTGQQALELGLIDGLGGREEAIADLRRLAGDKDERLAVGDGRVRFNNLLRQILEQSSRLGERRLGSWGDLLLNGQLNQVPVLWMAPLVDLH